MKTLIAALSAVVMTAALGGEVLADTKYFPNTP